MTAVQSELSRQYAHYAAIRARLMAAPARKAETREDPKAPALVVVATQPKSLKPEWQQRDIRFDHHVSAYRRHLFKQNSPTEYIRNRSEELGFTVEEITGRSRLRSVSNARQLIMFEVHKRFDRSTLEIGRFFGGRDHTTVLHALMKHGHRTKKTKGLSPKQIEDIKRRTENGATARELAEKYGVSATTIRNHTVEGYREANARRNALLKERRLMKRANEVQK
ncbi:helix-turn-helix domain-containing protein [Sinorhizobium meliloti]|uniref:helix-turn-helix domain-containing protein n=1 Tax=Rhizobium meliloti TaxID=382 RepID=UPI00398CEED1